MLRRFVAPVSDRLDKMISEQIPEISRSRAQALIREGRVTVGGGAARPSTKPPLGAEVVVDEPPPEPAWPEPEDIPIEILYQDPDLAVIFKPAGMVVHPAPGHSRGTLVNALLGALSDLSGVGGELRPGIVHRLDQGTSGVMVVAKNDVSHRALQEQLSAHTMERRYLALVQGVPPFLNGTIETQLGRDPRDRLKFASVKDGGRRAVTRWKKIEELHFASLLECRLETGRTHQIRVHMSEQGWPVLGDPLYRTRKALHPTTAAAIAGINHQLLHARVLAFTHPRTGEQLRFERPPPPDFEGALSALRAVAPTLRAPR